MNFRARRSTRLAGDDGAQLGAVETFGERFDLRRLAGALAAFEGDESSGL